jgi:outer membrane protein assembly factor BamD
MMVRNKVRHAVMFGVVPVLMLTSGCRHKYENPITKDTQQPDKVLFDTSIDDIEHGRYERARLTLQTMMNTYDTSEYLAKAKLAVADSWKREGGAHGMAQAEAEYKDFILFYPNMEEAAEAQYKICSMQYQQMDKSDRDPVHARMAEAECKDVLQKWPNSKFAPDATKMLLEVQEVLADAEMKVGQFYAKKGGNGYFSSANRLNAMVDQYPLYSQADEALWLAADDYNQMGDKYENKQAEMYTRIVRDYPLSVHAADAAAQLKAMNRPVPEGDPVAEARMKFEMQNRAKRGLLGRAWGPFSSRPDTLAAAKSGTPQMEGFRPITPLNVPPSAAGIPTTNEVTIGPVANRDILDKAPDARAGINSTDAATPPAAPATPAAGDAAKSDTAVAAPAAATAPAAPAAAAAANAKKAKPPKAVAAKKRARPAAAKKAATPAPTQTPPPVAAPAQSPAPTAGGGGAAAPRVPQSPEAPQP